MKGFKPTGYGPSVGFKFPTRMGFTGSTGNYTNVAPYTRRKAFADGGFVREDNPRMKVESIGDQGSALTRRAKSYNALDQESGGKSPLRPGFKRGGKAKKKGALAMAFGKKRLADGGRPLGSGQISDVEKRRMDEAIRRNKLESMEEAGMLSDADRAVLEKLRAAEKAPIKKADGGRVIREAGYAPRRENAYTFKQSLAAVPELIKEIGRQAVSGTKKAMYNRERTVGGTDESVGEAVARADTGASKYSKGGKAKRMGYQRGGLGMALERVRQQQARPMMRTPVMPARPMMMRSGGNAKRMGYANGGSAKKKRM